MTEDDQDKQPMTLHEVIGSVFAAAVGVQSSSNRERDLTRGSAKQFIVIELIATVLFVATIFTVVKIIIAVSAG